MPRTLEKTAKTVEEALKSALAELGVPESQVDYEVLEAPSKGLFGFLGGRPARIRVTVKEQEAIVLKTEKASLAEKPSEEEDAGVLTEVSESSEEAAASSDTQEPLSKAEKLLESIFASMHLKVRIEREETEDGHVFSLIGKDLGILIGKHGQTLDALQYLVNLAANRGLTEERVRVILDVEDYRRRREDTLKRLASRLADKVRRIHEEIKLEPMNRHERKIIHMALQDNRSVTTYSDGEEPYRYVVIAPKRREHRRGRREDAES